MSIKNKYIFFLILSIKEYADYANNLEKWIKLKVLCFHAEGLRLAAIKRQHLNAHQ